MNKPNLYMAPLQGITNCDYRNVYSRMFAGYDFAVAPFIRSCVVTSNTCTALRDLFPERNDTKIGLIPQILSNTPSDFISMAKALYDLGYKTVNLNLGCPIKHIRSKRRGAGLLPYPSEILGMLHKIIPAIPNQLSIKVRLGSENSREFIELLSFLNDLPLKDIIVHPRIGSQMYEGEVDLDAFAEVLSLSKHPVIYNGDIDSPETFKRLASRFPDITGWMIGRSGITNPFLPEKIKNLRSDTAQEKLKRFISFHDEILTAYQKTLSGPGHLMDKMKELWRYWAKSFKGGNKLFKAISKTRHLNNYLIIIVNKFFNSNPDYIN
ncbi:MAG: tRNA-dihydrouridine synthase family protein [bacterium]|nr:tRNA-dihydrouridine synthase family protein [bacterium]